MADGCRRCIPVPAAWSYCYHCQRSALDFTTTPSRHMGQHIRYNGYNSGGYTIFPTNLDDLALAPCGEFEHSNDAHSNSR